MPCPARREMCACGLFGPHAFSGKSCSIGDNFMKILVISGFLGAGKTTFIKALAEKTDKRFVVMENEYVGADGRVYLLHDEGRFCFLHSDDFQYA